MTNQPAIDLTRNPELLLLGGAPRTGKTQMAAALWQKAGIPGFGMDAVVQSFILLAPEAGIDWDDNPQRAERIAVPAHLAAEVGLETYGRYLLEGESITPELAYALQSQFNVRACFLVMTQPDVDSVMRYEGTDAWVTEQSAERRRATVDNIRKRSELLMARCEQLGHRFVDMSDGKYTDRFSDALSVLTGKTINV